MKKLLLLLVALGWFVFGYAQDTVFQCQFEQPSELAGWQFASSGQPNYWVVGTAPDMSSSGLYVTNTGSTNYYDAQARSVSYAYRQVVLPRGMYRVRYDWRCVGGQTHGIDADFMRVFMMHRSEPLTAGMLPAGAPYSPNGSLPEGYMPLESGTPLIGSSSWGTLEADCFVEQSDTFYIVMMWCNRGLGTGMRQSAAVDNLLIYRPACPLPAWPYADEVGSTSFLLHWTDLSGGSVAEWLVELDSQAQAYGQGALYSVYDTVASFMTLTPNTDYKVYLRAVCNGGDTTDTVSLRVHTECVLIASLPYMEGFDSVSSGGLPTCWQHLTDGDEAVVSFGKLLWRPNQSPFQCLLLPGIDTAVFPMGTLQLSFQGVSNGDGMPFEVGVMADVANPASFVPVGRVNVVSREWERYVVDFSNYTGTGNHIAIRAVENAFGYRYSTTSFDDFVIDRHVCQQVAHLAVSHTGATAARVEWSPCYGSVGVPGGYEVRVQPVDTAVTGVPPDSSGHYLCADPYCMLTELTPEREYRVWVRTLCAGGSMSAWDTVRFATLRMPCAEVDTSTVAAMAIGNGTNRMSGIPVAYQFANSLCQSIYTADELRAQGMEAGQILGIEYTFTEAHHQMQFAIYLSTTHQSSYNAYYPTMVPVLEQHLVYGPALHSQGTVGTVRHTFPYPIIWDGTSNLVVTTVMNNASMQMQPAQFHGYSTQVGANRTLYGHLDDEPYTLANLTSGTMAASQYRPTVAFVMGECGVEEECVQPTMVVERVEPEGVHVDWMASGHEDRWTLFYRREGDTGWMVADTNIDTNYYHLTNLQPNSSYRLRLLAHCGSDSLFHQTTFTTECALVGMPPWTEDFDDFEHPYYFTQMGPCWKGGGNLYPQTTSNYAHSDSLSLLLGNNASSGISYVALPAVDEAVGSLQVGFYTYTDGNVDNYDYLLAVGVMDDPADANTFQPVATLSPSAPHVWEEREVRFEDYMGEGRYIALASAGVGNHVYVDDLTVDYLPLCPRPRNITVDRITRTSAVVQWDGRQVGDYEVEYGPAGFLSGTGSIARTVYDSATLVGLNHSTRYDIYVRCICGDDTSARSFVTTFSTACGEIESLPYIENFAQMRVNNGDYPTCWVRGGYSNCPYVVAGVDGRGNPSGQSLYMPSELTVRSYVVLPPVDTVRYSVDSLQVLVEAHADIYSTYYSHHLTIGLCQTEGDITSFTPIDTIELTDGPTVYEVSLVGASTLGSSVAFVSAPMGLGYYNTVYLDSVALMLTPSCPVPYRLSATNPSATMASLTWVERGTALQWQVEYMPQGAPLGTGTRLVVGSCSLTLSGLAPATRYDFYVRSICGAGDTSQWSYNPGYFVTQQVPAAVPYIYDGDSLTEWTRWQTLSNTATSWHCGMAVGQPAPGVYLSSDSGSSSSISSVGVLNAVAYRDIDFGNIDTSFTLSFSASVGQFVREEGLVVMLTNPATPPAPLYNTVRQSPWGRVDTLSTLVEFPASTEWHDYSVPLDTLRGVHRLVFYAYGNAGLSAGATAVDNISVQYEPCRRPRHLRVVDVTVGSATVLWDGQASAYYRVRLYDSDGTLLATDTVPTNRIQYLTLLPSTTYRVSVGILCGDSVVEAATPYRFSTPACMEAMVDTVGDIWTAGSAVDVPLHICYPYSYTQQLVTASELRSAQSIGGEITSINFLYDSPGSITLKTNCTIYMGLTTVDRFHTINDFVPPNQLQAVYMGNLNCVQGWNRILLGSPFVYDGSSNLVIAICDNSGGNHYSDHHFASSPTSNPMTISFYGYDNINCSSSVTLANYAGGKRVLSSRSILCVEMCPPNSCPQPQLLVPHVHANSVTFRWRHTSDRYLVGYRRVDSDRWIENNVLTTDTFHTVDRFVFGDDYLYHVRQYCDSTGISNWAIGSFNTAAIPCIPPIGLTATDVTNHAAHLRWTPDDNHISYRLHVWGGGGYDTVVTTYLANGTVEGLYPASRYYAAVEVRCEYIDEPSVWSDTITFETTACPAATDLVSLEVHGNSALIDWQCDEGVGEWLVEWGLQGFDQGMGTTVIADHHPFLLTGLTGETAYDIFVQSVCGDGYVSENWSNRLTVTTEYSSVPEVSDVDGIGLYPNPTSGDVQLTLPADVGAVRVEVVDMTGRIRQTYALPPHTECATLSTEALPQGAYFVRVTGDNMSAVKKMLKIEN